MGLNPLALQNFAESEGQEAFDAPAEQGEGSAGDAGLDMPDNLSREAMQHRLQEPHVGYMEIESAKGKGFSCGNCRFLIEGAYCANTAVQSYVSEKKGCCNLFDPKDGEATPPDEWEAFSDLDGEGDEEEETKPDSEEGSEEGGDEGEDEDEE
jgi:hypothetical protein